LSLGIIRRFPKKYSPPTLPTTTPNPRRVGTSAFPLPWADLPGRFLPDTEKSSMRMLGTRFPDGSLIGSALTPDGNSGPVARSTRRLPTSRATRPFLAGTLPVTRQASGFITRLNRTQGQRPNRMTLPTPVLPLLIEYLESPQDAIDAPVAFPREPEPKQNTCPILRPNHGDQIPEEAPAIAVIEIETETGTAIEITTGPAVAEPAVVNSPAVAAPVAAALLGDRNVFR